MAYIITINKPLENHLHTVIEQMIELGAPTIRVVFDGQNYFALEGSHRVAAAEILGLTPELEIMELDEIMKHDISNDNLTQWTEATVGEIFEATWGNGYSNNPMYWFDEL